MMNPLTPAQPHRLLLVDDDVFLSDSEEQYRTLFETMAQGVVYQDTNGQIIAANPAAQRILGLTLDQMQGRTSLDPRWRAIREDGSDFPGELHPSAIALRTGRDVHGVVHGVFNPADEGFRWILVNATPQFRVGETEPYQVFTTFEDITERKHAEDALRASEERFRALIENSSDGIALLDIEGFIRYVSPSISAVLGYSTDEVVGQQILQFVHPDDLTYTMTQALAVMQTPDKPILFQHRLRHKDGTWRWIEAHDQNRLADPAVQAIVVNFRDTSERKAAEESLAASEEYLRALVEHSTDVITVLNADGTVRYTSPAHGQQLGDRGDGPRTSMFDRIHPDDAAQAQELFTQIYQTPEAVVTAELQVKHLDGSWRVIEATATNLLANPAVRGIVVNSRDTTERRRHAQEREAMLAVSAALRAAKNRHDLLAVVLDHLLTLTQAEGTVFVHIAPATGEFEIELARGRWDILTSLRWLPDAPSLSAEVMETRQPYLNNEIGSNPRYQADVQRLLGEVPCVVCVPLIAEEQAIGAIWMGRKSAFTPSEVHLVMAMADIAASALHRETLHQQTKQHVERLTILRSIDVAITSGHDLRSVLDVLINHATAHLRADAATVLVLDPPSLTLRYAAGRGFRSNRIKATSIRLGQGLTGHVALEHQTLRVPDLREATPRLSRPYLIAEEGFVAYCAVPLVSKGQTKGVLELFHRSAFQPDQEWLEFAETLGGQAAIAIDNASLFESLQRSNVQLALAYDATIEGWSEALDLRDKETEGHSQRVTELTAVLARQMGISDEPLVQVRRGALLHDIGKMGIPDAILLKPGPLTDEEWELMRKHPTLAYELLSKIQFLRPALDIPYSHHEKWDGSGYPRGLSGEQIPLVARIFAVVDVWDALTSDRPYRAAWSKERALAHIRDQAGIHFDPGVVAVFLQMFAGNPAPSQPRLLTVDDEELVTRSQRAGQLRCPDGQRG
jgi:PAS domain S-box-containing protein/putative nucleotidyltransferase with HDIG domain